MPGKLCWLAGQRKSLTKLLFLAFMPLAVGACGAITQSGKGQSSLDTVDLPVTPVEDQGRFGICWAYGTIGLVESDYKRRTGKEVNLSEEAIAFYRLAEMVTLQMHKSKTFPQYFNDTSRGFNEGFFSRILPAKKQPGELDAFELVTKYGLVPQTSWNFKINSPEARTELLAVIRQKSIRFLSGRDLEAVTVEEVIDQIMIGDGAFPSRPPTEFDVDGRTLTAVNFAKSEIAFAADDFEAVEVASEAELPRWITAVKKSLALGYAVPMGFPINIDRLDGGTFGAPGVSPDDPIAFARDGGHLVLVTDFVNIGGREGLVSPEEVLAEVAKPAEQVEYLKFKNSWGLGAKTDAEGKPIGGSPDGYYRMNRDYLVGSARAAAKGFLALNAVVPRSVLTPAALP
jgi:hypothetical protein